MYIQGSSHKSLWRANNELTLLHLTLLCQHRTQVSLAENVFDVLDVIKNPIELGRRYILCTTCSGNNSKVDSSSAKLDLGDRSQTMKLLCCMLFKFQAELKTLLTQLEQTDKISIPDFVPSRFQDYIHRRIEMGIEKTFWGICSKTMQVVKVSKSQKQILKSSFEPCK